MARENVSALLVGPEEEMAVWGMEIEARMRGIRTLRGDQRPDQSDEDIDDDHAPGQEEQAVVQRSLEPSPLRLDDRRHHWPSERGLCHLSGSHTVGPVATPANRRRDSPTRRRWRRPLRLPGPPGDLGN